MIDPPRAALPAPEGDAGQAPNIQVLGRRALALIIDTALIFLLESLLTRPFIPVHLRIATPTKLHGSLTFGLAHVSSAFLTLTVFLAALFLYFTIFESLFAATPGKLLCSLRVIDANGNRPAWTAILMRNLLRPIDAILLYVIGGLLVILTRRRQRLGDIAAHTTVAGAWSIAWLDRSRAAARQRAGIVIVVLLVLVLVSSILAYFLPPSISPGLNDAFTSNDSVVFLREPGAQRVLRLSVGSINHNGGTATYPFRFALKRSGSSRPEACTGTITYHWTGPLDGWALDRLTTRCVAGT